MRLDDNSILKVNVKVNDGKENGIKIKMDFDY
jgi:hypothetical protein